jgi:hypothetical protein
MVYDKVGIRLGMFPQLMYLAIEACMCGCYANNSFDEDGTSHMATLSVKSLGHALNVFVNKKLAGIHLIPFLIDLSSLIEMS